MTRWTIGAASAVIALGIAAVLLVRAPRLHTKAAIDPDPLTPISNDAMMLGNDFAALAATLGADNARPGPRTVPGRLLPVPATTSPEIREQIAAPYRVPAWNADPKDAAAWHALVARLADATASRLPDLRARLAVVSEPLLLGGVKAFRVAPRVASEAHRGKVIFAIHGGGFVFNPGEAGTLEAILLAGYGDFEVFAVDYRMAPDHPYPAANDDVFAAYKALLATHGARDVAVIGTWAGGWHWPSV